MGEEERPKEAIDENERAREGERTCCMSFSSRQSLQSSTSYKILSTPLIGFYGIMISKAPNRKLTDKEPEGGDRERVR